MLLLEASDIEIFMKERLLFKIEELRVHRNDRIGIVGQNGSGKTTLLEILAGKNLEGSEKIQRYGICGLIPQLKKSDSSKSGGEITQEYILNTFIRQPEILLADEPTTHLDQEHIEWIERKFLEWQGAFVIVSHDREFLDRLCTSIWEIDDGQLTIYKGNYSAYLQTKELQLKTHDYAYTQYKREKKQLEEALLLKEKKAAKATKKPKNLSSSEARITGAKPYFAKKQKKLSQTVKSIETRIEKLETIEKRKEIAPLKMDLPNEDLLINRTILQVHELEGMIGNRTLWKKASFSVRGGEKIAIIGKNGSGKTTLLKKLLCQENGVTFSPAVKIGYFDQRLEQLDPKRSILENVQSSSKHGQTLIRIILARLHFNQEDIFKKVEVLSGGERVKVALAKLFVSDCNTLILDEPTNFLDIEAIEALENLLTDYKGSVVIVSHDRRFIRKLASRVITIKNQGLHVFNGPYNELENVQTKKDTQSSQDQLLLIETRITAVLSHLSIEPTPELEHEFQELLKQKKALQ